MDWSIKLGDFDVDLSIQHTWRVYSQRQWSGWMITISLANITVHDGFSATRNQVTSLVGREINMCDTHPGMIQWFIVIIGKVWWKQWTILDMDGKNVWWHDVCFLNWGGSICFFLKKHHYRPLVLNGRSFWIFEVHADVHSRGHWGFHG